MLNTRVYLNNDVPYCLYSNYITKVDNSDYRSVTVKKRYYAQTL